MGAEKIEYEIGAKSGQAETLAAGFEKIAAAQEKTAAAQDKATKAQDGLTAAQQKGTSGTLAGAMAAQSQAAAVNTVGAAMSDATAKAVKFSDATKAANTNALSLRSQIGGAAGTVGQLANAFAELTPAAGAMNTVFGTLLRTMNPLLGLIGGGPGALVVGGLVAVVSSLGAVMSSAAKDADELAKQTTANADALGNYLDKIIEARGKIKGEHQQRAADAEDQKSLLEGKRPVGDYDEEIDALKTQLKSALTESAATPDFDQLRAFVDAGTKSHSDFIKAKIAALEDAKALASLYRHDEESGAAESAPKPDAKSTKMAAEKPQPKSDSFSSSEFMMSQAGQGTEPAWKSDWDARKAAMIEQSKLEQEIRDADDRAALASTTRHNALDAEEDKLRSDLRQKDLRAEIAKQQVIGAMRDKFAQAGAAMAAKTLQMALAGQKLELTGLLASIGNQMIAEGTMGVFSGTLRAAFSYGSDPTAYAMIATGGAELAAGIALSAAAGPTALTKAAGGTPTGGGVSGIGASPLRDNSQGSGTVVNNTYVEFNSPFSPSAETGQQIRQHLIAANNTYGPQV